MANRVLILRSALQKVMKEVHSHVYYENAGQSSSYPYIVYTLNNSIDDGTLENVDLEVDGWDMPTNGSTIPLEIMMGKVDDALHRSVYSIDGVFFTIYRENRRSIQDSDERLRRRQYVYQIRMMGDGM